MKDIDYEEIELYFLRNEYYWQFEEGKFVPTAADIKRAVDYAKELLTDEDEGARLDTGRLSIQKDHDTFNVYMYVGSTDGDNNE